MADWTDYVGGGTAGLGVLADLYSFFQNRQQAEQRSKIYDILSNPNKLAAYTAKTYQPMSAAANQAVQRDLGANWATMTGGAPGGSMNQYVADALAKIESQRYQSAQQAALESLRGALGAGSPGLPMGSSMNALQMMMLLKTLRDRQTPTAQKDTSIVAQTQDSNQWNSSGPWDFTPRADLSIPDVAPLPSSNVFTAQ